MDCSGVARAENRNYEFRNVRQKHRRIAQWTQCMLINPFLVAKDTPRKRNLGLNNKSTKGYAQPPQCVSVGGTPIWRGAMMARAATQPLNDAIYQAQLDCLLWRQKVFPVGLHFHRLHALTSEPGIEFVRNLYDRKTWAQNNGQWMSKSR